MFTNLCNTLFLFGLVSSASLIGCSDTAKPPDTETIPVNPVQGTILEEYCDDPHTLITIVADGAGGSITNETPNSEQCGYVAPPPAGTLLREGCSKDYPGVKWFQYADGEGGTYSEKDNRSVECGWEPPTLVLELEKAEGDRFYPAVVYVNYTDFLGEKEPWGMEHASTTIGSLERDGDYILIYGDGRTGDGVLTLGTKEIQFRIDPEPVCTVEDRIDCVGYYQKPSQEYIYYGEDDDTIVTWELGIFVYASHSKYGDDQTVEILEEWDETNEQWAKYQKKVESYNEVYELSGVHIRYKLTKLYLVHWHSTREISSLASGLPVDIVLGRGTTYPGTCGVANVKTTFRTGQVPASMSNCDVYVDLHEIGHSVGLAHGPENQGYPANGYIFPDFGHGWNDICGTKDDLMSYGYEGYYHSNSALYCDEIFTRNAYEGVPAGSKDFSDTAYTLNRIRYNVSLIHPENDYVDRTARMQRFELYSNDDDFEIID